MIIDSCVGVGLAGGMVAPRAEIDAAGDAPVFISTILLGELAFGVLAAAIEQTGRSPRHRVVFCPVSCRARRAYQLH
ncbi:hypothetical protein [Burkholderia cenocepacia]|uniref:hypothetical protein n=1 Tax=Burkholderia cenocepacia TaxID=95486 RepID=UPI002AB76C75|nr:hypothetical protein [Burkholderia cenocepacia]